MLNALWQLIFPPKHPADPLPLQHSRKYPELKMRRLMGNTKMLTQMSAFQVRILPKDSQRNLVSHRFNRNNFLFHLAPFKTQWIIKDSMVPVRGLRARIRDVFNVKQASILGWGIFLCPITSLDIHCFNHTPVCTQINGTRLLTCNILLWRQQHHHNLRHLRIYCHKSQHLPFLHLP
jgi:hypothetical protein